MTLEIYVKMASRASLIKIFKQRDAVIRIMHFFTKKENCSCTLMLLNSDC
jgi:hypothetical protein